MMNKIVCLSLLIVSIQSAPIEDHSATSYYSVESQSHQDGHIGSVPVYATQHAAVVPSVHVVSAAPVAKFAVAAAPAHHEASSYSSFSTAHVEATPTIQATVVKAAPVVHAAPVYQSSPVYETSAVHSAYAAPVVKTAHVVKAVPVVKTVETHVEQYAHPKYEFSYGVKDTHTGDMKEQHEQRDGDVVKGMYSVVDPDGTHRTVHYTADDHNGFNAVVERSGHAVHPQVHHVTKAVVAAPVVAKAIVAPVTKTYVTAAVAPQTYEYGHH